jgi:glycosyltransferase involved in cell wall biosynthesis
MSTEAAHPVPEILLLAPPFEARGICAYTVRLARGLRSRGWTTGIITADGQQLSPEVRAELNVHEWRCADLPFAGPVHAWWSGADLRPRLLHAQSPRMLRLANDLARRWRVPYVLTVHHLPSQSRLPIDRQWCRRVIAANSTVAAELSTHFGVPGSLVTEIPPGVEACCDPGRPIPLSPGHVPVIGAAGPLESDKGLIWFLGAARRVLDEHRDVEFVIAGAGPEETNLRRLARELKLAAQITFAPYVPDFQTPLRAMDVYCLPAVRQGLSATLLEAMALGLPIVASTVGGIDDVIDHEATGLLIPPQDLESLTAAFLRLLRNPAEAQRLGAAGRDLVARDFGVERMLDQTLTVYREVLPTVKGESAA